MKPLGRVVVVGAAGIAACVLLVSGALQSGSGTKNGEMGVASDGNFSAHPNLSRKASGGLDLSRVQVTDEDSEEVQPSAWNVLASDAADRIERAVLDSGGKAIYSTIVIDRTQKEIVVYFTTAPASETLDAIRQASDDIPVKVLDEAKVTNAQFVEMVEHMYATIDP
ncbi:MAG: hypothetical protein J0H64_06400, partial [Actinobacteria bacterium]|nr:hypothetical protein [Actinomycetota bacterium]